MKSFAAAALIGATSAEPSFLDFITDMAIQEAEAAKYQAEQPRFAFQELLTQMHIDEIQAFEAKQQEVYQMEPLEVLTNMAMMEMENKKSFSDMIANKVREERDKPSMVDVFTAMTIDRRENEESLLDAFTAMTIQRREREAEQVSFVDLITTIAKVEEEEEDSSLMDAFTAMAIKRREQPKPSFIDFMVGLAKAESAKPLSFVDQTKKMVAQNREKPSMIDAFTAMTLDARLAKNEPVKLFEKGLPHAMAMMAVKQHEASQAVKHQKEITFLNDVLHPDSVYEPFTFTAMKAATKYLTN